MADPYLQEWTLREVEANGLKPLAKSILKELNIRASDVRQISAVLAKRGFSRNKLTSFMGAIGNSKIEKRDVERFVRQAGLKTTHSPGKQTRLVFNGKRYFSVAIPARQRAAIMKTLGRDCLGNKLAELYADPGRISLESVGVGDEIMPTMLAFSSEQEAITSNFQKHHGLQFTRSVVVRSAIEELIEEQAPQFKRPPNWQPAPTSISGEFDPHDIHGFVLIKPAYNLLKDACKYTDYDIDYLCSVAIKRCDIDQIGDYWIPYRRWTQHPTVDVSILLPQSAHNRLLELVSFLRFRFAYYAKYRPDKSTVLMAALLQVFQAKQLPISADPFPQEVIDNWRAVWDW